MFADQISAAVDAARGGEALDRIKSVVWTAWGAGEIDDATAQSLDDMAEAKRKGEKAATGEGSTFRPMAAALPSQAQTQHRLPLARPRMRSVRRSFATGSIVPVSPYRPPHEVGDRLTTSLTPYRNRVAAFTLAVFVARFWSAPRRIVEAFTIDRRALAGHPELGLTERQVRSAIRVLEEVGFLVRAIASGSRYHRKVEGLRCKPIQFRFGPNYADLFVAANRRAAAARGRPPGSRPSMTPASASRPSTASAAASFQSPKCPESRNVVVHEVYSGHQAISGIPPSTSDQQDGYESHSEHPRKGIRLSRGGLEEGSGR